MSFKVAPSAASEGFREVRDERWPSFPPCRSQWHGYVCNRPKHHYGVHAEMNLDLDDPYSLAEWP